MKAPPPYHQNLKLRFRCNPPYNHFTSGCLLISLILPSSLPQLSTRFCLIYDTFVGNCPNCNKNWRKTAPKLKTVSTKCGEIFF